VCHVVRDSPTSWSIEGETSTIKNSWLVYIVTFEDTHFKIQVISNAGYEGPQSNKSRRIKIGKDRSKMKNASIVQTKDLSEKELIDALLEADRSAKKVCPCAIRIACPCPCACTRPSACQCSACACAACACAHPCDSDELPSLWGSPRFEPLDKNLPTEIGQPSAYLRNIPTKDAALVYHSLLGNLRYAHPEITDFFGLAKKGISIEELALHFPDINLEAEIRTLRQLGFLVVGDEDIRLREKIVQRERSIENGEMIRCLRLNTASGCNLACTYCHTDFPGRLSRPPNWQVFPTPSSAESLQM